jgi:AcrR family transcriptional regulator
MTSTAPTSTDPSRGSGTRRSSGEVRALLVEAARELFTEQGYRATTRDIATRAGVAESLIFTRFGSKAELFQVTVVSAFTDFIDDFVTSWEANPVDSDIEEIAASYIDGLYAMARRNRRLLRALMAALVGQEPVVVDGGGDDHGGVDRDGDRLVEAVATGRRADPDDSLDPPE